MGWHSGIFLSFHSGMPFVTALLQQLHGSGSTSPFETNKYQQGLWCHLPKWNFSHGSFSFKILSSKHSLQDPEACLCVCFLQNVRVDDKHCFFHFSVLGCFPSTKFVTGMACLCSCLFHTKFACVCIPLCGTISARKTHTFGSSIS